MSDSACAAVTAHKGPITPEELLILLLFANSADPKGFGGFNIERLALASRLSMQAVQSILYSLINAGLLEVQGDTYRLLLMK